MSKLSICLRIFLVAFLAFAIVGEETIANRGSPLTLNTDVAKMVNILINSLYTNRNVFLRELISNGSDALDKIRFLYLTALKEPKNDEGVAPTMDIRIRVDKERRHVIISDGGVGMTKEELAKNLGSLGTSGTQKFLEQMKNGQDANFIGQFGVGFYSVFLVAERVKVASKSDDSDKQYIWESTGSDQYYIYEDERGNTLGRGSEITLELKKDADEYLDMDKIKETIHRYSEFIHFPIYTQTIKTEKVAKKKEESTGESDDSEDGKEGDNKKEEETEEVVKTDWELVNENKPIWTRKPSEITEDEYNKFYKAMTKDYDDPLYYSHFAVEGEVVFKSILFIPGKAPGNVFDPNVASTNIRLYVRRVFITDEFRDLLPRYLNFIKGVVDSDDLPLNVSREVLQENRILKVIKKRLVRKALQMLTDIAASDKSFEDAKKDPEGEDKEDNKEEKEDDKGGKKLKEATFSKFWEEYGKHLRLGMIEDGTNRNKLTKLLRYKTSKSEDKLISFDQYIARMPETQKEIYYVAAGDAEKIKQLPVLEDATNRKLEVVYMTDAIDEYVVGHITEYDGKKLVNLAKEGVKTDKSKNDKKVQQKRKEKFEPLFEWFRELLGEKVSKVAICERYTSEPLIISSRNHDITANMARIIKGQALSDKQQQEQSAKRVLEINHLHPLVDELFKRVKVDKKDKVAEDLALVLFDTANLQNGFEVEDSLAFARRINRMLRQSVDIAADATLLEEDISQYDLEDADDEDDDKEEAKPEESGNEEL